MKDREQLGRELRRSRDTLVVIGTGVVAFGFWSILKTVIILVLQRAELFEDIGDTEYKAFVIVLFGIFITIALGADLLLRLYVGRSARAEGFGERRGSGYIVLASLMAAVSIAAFVLNVIFFSADSIDTILDAVVSYVVEITSIVTMLELIVAAVRVRKLDGELEQGD